MFGLYFADQIPRQLSDVSGSDIAYFNRFFHAMLTRGVYLAPSAYEAGFVSIQHDNSVIEETLASAQGAFKALG
jgi:glutamate-1-semialdehyde 2,1-aminomutase